MTEARLVTREQLAAALHKVIPYPSTWPGDDQAKWSQHYADAIFAALPAAAPAEGLREALLRLVDEHAFIDYPRPHCDCEEWPAKSDTDKHWDEHFATVAAAALARHEPEGEKED